MTKTPLPFRYGQVVTGTDFCGREKLIDQLSTYIEAGQNVLLQGERRIGKTSLVMETVRRMGKRRIVAVNLMEVKSVDDLCKRLLHSVLAMERSGGFFERLLRTLSYLRPKMEINPYTGGMTISFDSQVSLGAESIGEVLSLFRNIHKDRSLVVFFDEFQDILKINDSQTAIALLRGEVQHQGEVPYIFAGSVRNEMDGIFNHPDSPFFKSAITLAVNPLGFTEFGKFLLAKFEESGRKTTRSFMKRVFELAEEVSGDIQQLCDALWASSSEGDSLNEEVLHRAYRLIFAREQKSYEQVLAQLPAGHVQILDALARLGGETPTGKDFVRQAALSNPSAVRQGLLRLSALKIVWNDGGRRWRFSNPFFKAWLLARHDLD